MLLHFTAGELDEQAAFLKRGIRKMWHVANPEAAPSLPWGMLVNIREVTAARKNLQQRAEALRLLTD